MKKFPWQLLGGTPLGLFVLAMIAIIARDVWHPSLPDEILWLFLLLLLALGLTHERLMFRINLLGEGLHIHLDQAGMSVESPTTDPDAPQPSLLAEIREIKEKLEEMEERG